MSHNIQVHVRNLGFPEGPVVLTDGSIAFVDLLHAKIRMYKDNYVKEIATLPGAPNGMRLGSDGALYVCNNGGLAPKFQEGLKLSDPAIPGCIQRVTLDGLWSTFASDLPGAKPSRPNDLIFSPEGGIIFTDPQNWETLSDNPDAYHGGQLLYADKTGAVCSLAKLSQFPNGLAFLPNGTLLVNTSLGNNILAFDWIGQKAQDKREWHRFDQDFMPDGMIVEHDLVFVTGSVGDRIAVLDLHGNLMEMIALGEGSDPTNVCAHDGKLWVTLGYPGQLISVDL